MVAKLKLKGIAVRSHIFFDRPYDPLDLNKIKKWVEGPLAPYPP